MRMGHQTVSKEATALIITTPATAHYECAQKLSKSVKKWPNNNALTRRTGVRVVRLCSRKSVFLMDNKSKASQEPQDRLTEVPRASGRSVAGAQERHPAHTELDVAGWWVSVLVDVSLLAQGGGGLANDIAEYQRSKL
jgi:hypothetical protein